jgi:hypothetical protein
MSNMRSLLRIGYRLRFVQVVLVGFLCLELNSASAQRVASRRQPAAPSESRDRTRTNQEEIDALIAEAQARAGAGGSVRVSQKKEKSSVKTVYIDETDSNVPHDQLVRENLKVYIDSQSEQSKSVMA